ncbi:MAG: HD-GYP domain-containing protein [Candidatus Omnitrophota bacterium]|nr:HD-GYP domain-containing protein [Candidatus Omnitrophota bacterium]
MENKAYKKSIKTEILSIVLLSVFIITAILGYLSFTFSKTRLNSMLSDSVKGIAATTASFIKPEDILLIRLYSDKIKERYMSTSSVTFSHIYEKMGEAAQPSAPDRLNDAIAAYIKYKDLLTNIKKMNKIDSPINVYVADNQELNLILTTENILLANAVYNLRPESKKALSENFAQSTGVYRDKDGTWISAYAPVPSVYSVRDKILVEINYKIDSYIARLRKELGIIVLICLAGFLITALMGYKLVTALVSAIQKLDKAAHELENENYYTPIDVKSDDEVGHLADTFEKLRVSIGEKIDELKLSIVREKRAHLESVVALTNAIEMRDPYTKEHLSRVVKYALLIAKELGLSKDEMIELKYACFLHDVGKIYIETELLNKKIKLDAGDMEEIKKHSERGAKIIEGIKFLEGVKSAVLYHQERYDGKGYPEGLKGDQIPPLARIVSVADAFDAMTSDRPYKPKMSFAEAMDEVEKHAGTQFDPKIARAFLKYRNSIEDIAKKHFESSD